MAGRDDPAQMPRGYRFLRVVLLVGGIGFGILGVFYLLGGQWAPGVFALVVGALELAALPLLRTLLDKSRSPQKSESGKKSESGSDTN